MNAISMQNVSKHFELFSLQNLSFELPAGTICGLVGENGAGKSTTMRILLGTLAPDQGVAHVLGIDSSTAAFSATRQDIGVVQDELGIPDSYTAHTIDTLMGKFYHHWDRTRFQTLCSDFQLPMDKPVGKLSRGMQMQVSMARALSHHPKLLVLDEATSGLDPMMRNQILDLLLEFIQTEDNSVLLSSHILSDLEKVCDSIAFLHQGKLLFHAPKDDLLDTLAIFQGTKAQMEELDSSAILGVTHSEFGGCTALVYRGRVPTSFPLTKPTMEQVMLLTIQGGTKR